MLHIILLILKIIGIVLLCLLGLLLLGLCLILFVPVFFEAEVRDEDAFSARGALSWLGIGLRGKFSYEEELQFSLRIFGIRIFPSKEKKESSKEKKKAAVTETEPEEREKPPSPQETYETDQEGKAEQKEKAETTEEKGSQGKEEDNSEEKGKKKRLQKRISLRKKKGKEEKQRKKKKEGASFFSQIKGILQEESCREGIIKMMSYMLSFFQSFHMKEAEGEADFSWGEPDLTGKTLGLISMFPFVYGEKLEINPDFLSEDAYFRGWLKIGGSFQLVYLLILIIRMVKDKEVRKVIFSLIGKG